MTDVSVLSASESRLNVADAIRKLRAIDPVGRHDLAAIDPRKVLKLEAKTFFGTELDRPDFEEWLKEKERAGLNVHHTPNCAREGTPLDRRLSAADIGYVRATWVDDDSPERNGVRWGDPCDDDLPPSLETFSGGGHWAFWIMERPVPVEKMDGAAQNKALAVRCAGDLKSTDLSHLARLEGTVNFPDAGKVKKGRVPTLSTVTHARAVRYSPRDIASWCPLAHNTDVVKSRENNNAARDIGVELDTAENVADASAYALLEAPLAVEFEGGDNTTFIVACEIRDRGVSRKIARTILDGYNGRLESPWASSDLDRFVDSAYRNGQNPPGLKAQSAASIEFEPVEIAASPSARLPLHWATTEALANIPDRQWVLGKFLVRRAVTALVSPGGTGKTTFAMMVAVALATGRSDILGFPVHERTRVMVWNQEDDYDEMRRRLRAVLQWYDLTEADCEIDGRPGIVMGSGVERKLVLVKRGANGLKIGPDTALLAKEIRDAEIGAVILDPLVELHQANENDNVEMAVVGGALRDDLAVAANCAVLLNHHTRKPPQANANGFAGDMDAGRGAGAMNGVYRVVATLFNMDQKTAKDHGIPEEKRHLYVRFDDAKANMSLKSGEPVIFRREGVRLPESVNDEVGVLSLVKLARTARNADTLLADVLDLLDGKTEAWVVDLAEELGAGTFYAMDKPNTLARRISTAFQDTKNTNGWAAETAVRRGHKGLRVRLTFKGEEGGKLNGKQTENIDSTEEID